MPILIEEGTVVAECFRTCRQFSGALLRVAFLQIMLVNDLAYNEFSAFHSSSSST